MNEEQRRMDVWLKDTDAWWMWPEQLGTGVNQYVEFRTVFELAAPDRHAELAISADSEYVVHLNGVFVNCGQFPDVPPQRTVDALPVGTYLKTGRNVLTLGIHYQGITSFQYLAGNPGVVFALRAGGKCLVSGRRCSWRTPPHYAQGPRPRITSQLGFTFEYDARGTAPWRRVRRPDLRAAAASMELVARPLPKLEIGERLTAHIIAQGVLLPAPGPMATGPAMLTGFLSSRPLAELLDPPQARLPAAGGLSVCDRRGGERGLYLVIDLGREEVGFLDVELEADAGVQVDVGHGEHLDDLRVRTFVGNRTFANRHVCRAGRQTFFHPYHRMAGRYLQLHVHGVRKRFRLFYAGLRPALFPAKERGVFRSADTRQEAIYRTAVRTLRLCMHEHYEDCPWREQALYANDSRNQALSGYYAFGDARFPAVSLGLLAAGLKPDGWLEMCMPSQIDITIPSFTLVWVLAIADHWRHTGDATALRRMLPVVKAVLTVREAAMRNNLLPCPAGPRYWQFYDWADGLHGTERRLAEGERRWDALLNLLLCLAFREGAMLAAACGAAAEAKRWTRAAAAMRPVMHAAFWDARSSAYRTSMGAGVRPHFAELTQALAILSGTARPELAAGLRRRLADGDRAWTAATLSQSLYTYEALLSDRSTASRALVSIDAEWGRMLQLGATSFWETRLGAADFGGAGSLCHGWSAIPVYFYGAYVLGVKPGEPGFRTVRVQPVPGALPSARGEVPTPHGPVAVEWEVRRRRLRGIVDVPAGCRCIVPAGIEVRRPAIRRHTRPR